VGEHTPPETEKQRRKQNVLWFDIS